MESKRSLTKIFVGLLIMELVATIDVTGVTVLLPTLQEYFQLKDDMSGIILASYILPFTLFLVPIGWIADKTKPEKILQISIISFAIASFFCAISTSFEMFIIFRFIKGVASAGMFATEFTIIIKYWKDPWETFEKVVTGIAIGLILGPLAASGFAGQDLLIFNFPAWRYFFLIGTLLGIIGFLLYIPITKIKPVSRKTDRAISEIPKTFWGKNTYLCKIMFWGIVLNLIISIAMQGINIIITLHVQNTLEKSAWYNGLILMTIALGIAISNVLQIGSTIGKKLENKISFLNDIEIAAWGCSFGLAIAICILPMTNWIGYYVFPIYFIIGMLFGIPLASIEIMVLRDLKTDVLAQGNGIIVSVMQGGYVIASLSTPFIYSRFKDESSYLFAFPIFIITIIFLISKKIKKIN